MRRRILAGLVVGLITGGLVLVPAISGRAEEKVVTMSLLGGFSPERLEIRTGDEVIWQNDELFEYPSVKGTHQVVADDGSFESPPIAPGAAWSKQFLAPASIPYHCKVHPETMKGELVVTGPVVKPPALKKSIAIVERNASNVDTWGYDPADITVQAGTTITWRNNGAQSHTVTADDKTFASPMLAPGATWSFTFEKAAAIRYRCEPHPFMEAVVRVAEQGKQAPAPAPPPKKVSDAGAAAPVLAPPTPAPESRDAASPPKTFTVKMVEPDPAKPMGWTFQPNSLGIRVNDTVVWENAGQQGHTVTAEDGSFDAGMLAAGATFKRTFTTPATVRFYCKPHPWMKGVIAIAPASSAPGAIAPPAAAETSGSEPVPESGAAQPDVAAPVDPGSTTPVVGGDKVSFQERMRLAGIVAVLMLLMGLAVGLPSGRAVRAVLAPADGGVQPPEPGQRVREEATIPGTPLRLHASSGTLAPVESRAEELKPLRMGDNAARPKATPRRRR